MVAKDFRTVYCELRHCSPEQFEHLVFWECIPESASALTRFVYRLSPGFFGPDFALIRAVARSTSVREISSEIDAHRYHFPAVGMLRGRLKVRVSGQLLINLAARHFSPETEPGKNLYRVTG